MTFRCFEPFWIDTYAELNALLFGTAGWSYSKKSGGRLFTASCRR
jgi:hypothetical protein